MLPQDSMMALKMQKRRQLRDQKTIRNYHAFFVLSNHCSYSVSSLSIAQQQLFCLDGDTYLVVVMCFLGSEECRR
jgi:hypothetical protein